MITPEGYYNASAVEVDGEWVQLGFSWNKGTPQAAVTLKITDGEFAGRILTWIGYFPEDNKEVCDRSLESLRNLGFKGDDLTQAPTQPLENVVPITVKHEEYEGKKRARVAWINKPGGGGFKMEKKMTKDDLGIFAAKMKSRLSGKPAVEAAAKVTNGASKSNPDIKL